MSYSMLQGGNNSVTGIRKESDREELVDHVGYLLLLVWKVEEATMGWPRC
jgi:hypothetical protein